MKNIPIPSYDDALDDLASAIAPSKLKGKKPGHILTDSEKKEIESLYDDYVKTCGSPSEILAKPSLDTALCELIHDAYRHVQKRGRLNSLRNKLLLAAPRCAFCGIGAVTDLDHHLPRSIYKALAVFAPNLVPCCHQCNGLKHTTAANSGDPPFLNAYLDSLPDEQFIIANAHLTGPSIRISFSIQKTASLSADFYERLEFQMTRLDLNARYQPEVNLFICNQSVALFDAYGDDKSMARVRTFLERTVENLENRLGPNDWRTALTRALSEHDDFCDGHFVEVLG